MPVPCQGFERPMNVRAQGVPTVLCADSGGASLESDGAAPESRTVAAGCKQASWECAGSEIRILPRKRSLDARCSGDQAATATNLIEHPAYLLGYLCARHHRQPSASWHTAANTAEPRVEACCSQ